MGGEERSELIGAMGQGKEDVGHETRLPLHRLDHLANVCGQVFQRRDRKPGNSVITHDQQPTHTLWFFRQTWTTITTRIKVTFHDWSLATDHG